MDMLHDFYQRMMLMQIHTHDNSISYVGKDELAVISDSLTNASYEIILKLHKLNYI